MTYETKKSIGTATFVTALLTVAVVIGSRNLAHFDAALVGYTFASLFAVFAITYRYSMWLQRPPTQVYWRRGLGLLFRRKDFIKNLIFVLKRIVLAIGFNDFIWRRGKFRGGAHLLIMWGCFIAALITFPLVFGWLYFVSLPNDPESYQIVVFGLPTLAFRVESISASFIFHGLVIASVLVITGTMIAMRRRMIDRDAVALQTFGDDILPLILLFAVSITGVMLTVSYTWMKGYGYSFLAVLHAIVVIFTLLWLPFGKFFHIFMRPAQFGVALYKMVGAKEEQAYCMKCQRPISSLMHVEDLIKVQDRLGYDYHLSHQVPDQTKGHYQYVCPVCRRALLALSQGKHWAKTKNNLKVFSNNRETHV